VTDTETQVETPNLAPMIPYKQLKATVVARTGDPPQERGAAAHAHAGEAMTPALVFPSQVIARGRNKNRDGTHADLASYR
jgi:hypothetical protein